MCRECARARGIFDPRKLSMANSLFPSEISGEVESFIRKMLESAGMDESENELHDTLPDMLTECPACHYTLDQYKKLGLLGCPECYKVFTAEIQGVSSDEDEDEDLEDEDDGEADDLSPIEPELLETPALEIGRLKVQMHDAIRNEDYEEAARLRDRIKKLQS